MSANFKVLVHRNSENIHLKLEGDFDGDSAHEVIDMLKYYCTGSSRVFIHTACIDRIDSFGRHVFLSHLNSIKQKLAFLVVTGEKAFELIPDVDSSDLCVTVH
ncbi:MAG: anti-sigma factor antagonist [Deltaproteobacteria bacterium]|nr:anti-sigma factor antagonist [Deltaproteobacteria bacterium]